MLRAIVVGKMKSKAVFCQISYSMACCSDSLTERQLSQKKPQTPIFHLRVHLLQYTSQAPWVASDTWLYAEQTVVRRECVAPQMLVPEAAAQCTSKRVAMGLAGGQESSHTALSVTAPFCEGNWTMVSKSHDLRSSWEHQGETVYFHCLTTQKESFLLKKKKKACALEVLRLLLYAEKKNQQKKLIYLLSGPFSSVPRSSLCKQVPSVRRGRTDELLNCWDSSLLQLRGIMSCE